MSEQALRFQLKGVKILGFDPNIKNRFGKYSAQSLISDEDADKINSYIYGKVSKNQDGENVFFVDARTEIIVFDENKKRVTEPINDVFIADVAVLIDEFQSKDSAGELEFESDGSPKIIRYIKTEAIRFISKVVGEAPKIQAKPKENFEDFFSDSEEIEIPEPLVKPLPQAESIVEPKANDLPF